MYRFPKYFLLCVSLLTLYIVQKTAVVYSRRPPGVLVFITALRLSNSIKNRSLWKIRVWKCSRVRFCDWLTFFSVELSQSKQTEHIGKVAGRVKQTSSRNINLLSGLNWAEHEAQHLIQQMSKE